MQCMLQQVLDISKFCAHMLAGTSLSGPTIPKILATILSPDAMGQELNCQRYQTHSDFQHGCTTLDITNCKSQMDPVHFELKLKCGLLFTEHMIAPTEAERMSPCLPDGTCPLGVPNDTPCSGLCPSMKDVNLLTCNQLQALWHTCVLDTSMSNLCQTYKCVVGAPAPPCSDVWHSCPLCAQAKLHKANHSDTDTTKATNCW